MRNPIPVPAGTRPLRIAMLVGAYAPEQEGGAERQCRLLARALAGRGHAVTVITVRHTREAPGVAEESRVRVVRLGACGPRADAWRRGASALAARFCGRSEPRAQALAFWLSLLMVRSARGVFLSELRCFASAHGGAFDLLHVHESGWLAGAGVEIGRTWGVPVICKEATAPPLGAIGYDTPRRCSLDVFRRKADTWIAQTPAVAAELIRLGILAERIHLLPNGVAMPEESADPASACGVLYVGNLTQGAAWKAFDVLFDAWVMVARDRPDARLVVVGGGDPSMWYEVLRRGGARDTVQFAGRVPDPSLFYRAAGIFVLPSRIEGMSNALLEAQSYGLPCVVSDIPGNRAVVADGVNGRCVPVGDARALANAILSLLKDPAERIRLGAAARHSAAENFGLERFTDRVVKLYAALVAQSKAVPCA